MDDGFGIALRAVTVPASLQVLAQVPVVIDFPVEYDPDVAIFVTERLVTALDIDNAEAAHGQSGVAVDKEAVVVGTAMNDLPVHRRQQLTIHSLNRVGMENAADSTHGDTPITFGSLPGHDQISVCHYTIKRLLQHNVVRIR
jgi:hypothetical protein